MEHRFYAIQTTAGHENKVRSLIQRKIEADPKPAEERLIRQALVPTSPASTSRWRWTRRAARSRRRAISPR
jgi:transcription antitermination factor NusG